MEMQFPYPPFDQAELAVMPDSQLDTLAHLNPTACIQFAEALLKDLEGALAACTLGTGVASLHDRFEQIHSLKNMVIATGCRQLVDACAALHSWCATTQEPAGARDAFAMIVAAAQHLIASYRDGLVGRMAG